MFKAAKLSQDLSVTKSSFVCSIWILSVMHTASYYRKKSSNFDVDTGLLSTVHECFVTNGRKSHFFRLTQSTKL